MSARRSGATVLRLLSVLLLILPLAAEAATPLSSFSNTQQSTSATTLQNSDVVISGGSLENGKDFLILYSASYG
ncbi:MAG: hypothetical protein ABIJ61_01560, partial [bacterium]